MERVNLKKEKTGGYIILARPNADISEKSVEALAGRADKEKLDFVGVVNGRAEGLCAADYDKVINLSQNPGRVMAIRNICAAVYRTDFLKKNGITAAAEGTLFPDLETLWQTFVFADRALFVDSSICDEVRSDTVWIDDPNIAFEVNRAYDHIKDVLMRDWNRWEKWKSYFCFQQYRCYYELLHWMNEDAAWLFAERMAVDLHRSRVLGEVDESLFTPEERTALHLVDMDHGFFKRFFLGKVILDNRVYRTDKAKEEAFAKIDDLEMRKQAAVQRADRLESDLRAAENRMAENRELAEQTIEQLRQHYDEELAKERSRIENSVTFRTGRAVMYIPSLGKRGVRKIKRMLSQ